MIALNAKHLEGTQVESHDTSIFGKCRLFQGAYTYLDGRMLDKQERHAASWCKTDSNFDKIGYKNY